VRRLPARCSASTSEAAPAAGEGEAGKAGEAGEAAAMARKAAPWAGTSGDGKELVGAAKATCGCIVVGIVTSAVR